MNLCSDTILVLSVIFEVSEMQLSNRILLDRVLARILLVESNIFYTAMNVHCTGNNSRLAAPYTLNVCISPLITLFLSVCYTINKLRKLKKYFCYWLVVHRDDSSIQN